MPKQIGFLALFLLITYGASGLGAIGMSGAFNGWYQSLVKPAFNPPAWVFGPAWTLLYTLMAVAAWLVWRRGGAAPVTLPLTLYGVQLFLNVVWSPLFFGLRSPGLALIDILLLWPAILLTLLAFWRVSPVAGALLIPYQLWVTFATVLNYTIWRLNPPA